jgi:hypothetical protein
MGGHPVSRDYRGTAYRALVILEDGRNDMLGMTEPASYEDVERAVLLYGMGVPFEGRRVKRAMVVPVSGADAPEPGSDWRLDR